MMMPANFTAVNSEVVYGGGALETIGAYTADVWSAKNFKQFNTNLITLISNSFGQKVIDVTLGTMFGGNWGSDGVKLFGDDGSFTSLYKVGHVAGGDDQNFLNKVMTTLGIASVVYTLGTSSAKEYFSKDPRSIALNKGTV